MQSLPTLRYTRPAELSSGVTPHFPIVVIGAGPVGLTAAHDLASHGIRVLLLDREEQLSEGSRAICFSKRTLEIFERLDCVAPMRARGVTWSVGRIFHRDREVYRFNLLPEEGHAHPAFINLQQYHLEALLVERLLQRPEVEARWRSTVTQHEDRGDHVRLTVETPDGAYDVTAEYVLACDGAHSPTRKRMGLDYSGVVFEEKFLIADVVMQADFPSERWFWFAPPFHNGHSMLLHKQPDNLWRIDFQLGRDADEREELRPERIIPRVRAMLGANIPFELAWASIYSFHSRRLDRFVHGRVIYAGDAAHLMSPFGARGCNSGIQDIDNLAWKLALVLQGRAPASLLESYNVERVAAAQENLAFTESSTSFIAPAGPGELALRDAVLELARRFPFARALINSGRLSTPTLYCDSPLSTPDVDLFTGRCPPGAPAQDAPVTRSGEPGYLLGQLGGGFDLLIAVEEPSAIDLGQLGDLARLPIPIQPIVISSRPLGELPAAVLALHDREGLVRERFDLRPGSCYLLRPDQHVAARWRKLDQGAVMAALDRATGRSL